jgi:hypothetical protein
VFRAKIREWLKVLRKANGSEVMATQSLQSWLMRLATLSIYILGIVPIITWFFVFCAEQYTQSWLIEQFNAERTALLADPQGFPMLQKVAREQYGIEVVLADRHESSVSRMASASMELQAGYSRLTMLRKTVLASYDRYRIGQEDSNLLVKGVMMHQFAHCLHVSRNMPAFDHKVIGTRSLAPVDAREDLERYLEAKKSFKTRLWREAAADTFAVGYGN